MKLIDNRSIKDNRLEYIFTLINSGALNSVYSVYRQAELFGELLWISRECDVILDNGSIVICDKS